MAHQPSIENQIENPPSLFAGTQVAKSLSQFDAISHQSIVGPFAKVSFICRDWYLTGADIRTIKAAGWSIRSTRPLDDRLEVTIQTPVADH